MYQYVKWLMQECASLLIVMEPMHESTSASVRYISPAGKKLERRDNEFWRSEFWVLNKKTKNWMLHESTSASVRYISPAGKRLERRGNSDLIWKQKDQKLNQTSHLLSALCSHNDVELVSAVNRRGETSWFRLVSRSDVCNNSIEYDSGMFFDWTEIFGQTNKECNSSWSRCR